MSATRDRIRILLREARVHEEDIVIPEIQPDDDGTPASSRQTWALKSITGKDFRGQNLTAKQASWMIDDLNKKSGYSGKKDESGVATKPPRQASPQETIKDGLTSYLMDHIDDLVNVLRTAMGMVSGIRNDISGKMTPHKFYGGGLGFAWLEFDKRSQKAKSIYDLARSWELRDFINKEVIRRGFSKEEQAKLPLIPMVSQDMSYNEEYMGLVAQYMGSLGIRVSIRSRLD